MYMTKTIASNLLNKYSTRLHPFVKRAPLANSRGKLLFTADTCIMCRLCALRCPSKVITVEPEIGLWHCNLMGCVQCGVCADVCPTNCIHMSEEYQAPFIKRTELKYYCTPRPKKNKDKEAKTDAAETKKAAETDKAVQPADTVEKTDSKNENTPPAQLVANMTRQPAIVPKKTTPGKSKRK